MKLPRLIFILVFFIGIAPLFAQTDSLAKPPINYDRNEQVNPVRFDENLMDEFKNDSDYDYTEVKSTDSWWGKFKRWFWKVWDDFWYWLLGDYKASKFWSFVIRNLPYFILCLVIGFAIYLFIKLNPANSFKTQPKKPEVFLSEEEKIIHSENIEDLIKQALAESKYRLAIRYSYLLVLKKLKEKELIDYQFQKTNHEYFNEIEAKPLNSQFQKITRIYDFIWYGDFPVTANDYQKAEKEFNSINQQLN